MTRKETLRPDIEQLLRSHRALIIKTRVKTLQLLHGQRVLTD